MGCRSANSDKIAENVQESPRQVVVVAQDEHSGAAIEKFDRLRDKRVEPIDVVREQSRQ